MRARGAARAATTLAMIGTFAVVAAATAEVREDPMRSVPADEMRAGEVAIPADSAGENDASSVRPNPNRYVKRFRLDDGRYRGFHQNNPDELRAGDAVQAENDRIRAEHRARGRDLSP